MGFLSGFSKVRFVENYGLIYFSTNPTFKNSLKVLKIPVRISGRSNWLMNKGFYGLTKLLGQIPFLHTFHHHNIIWWRASIHFCNLLFLIKLNPPKTWFFAYYIKIFLKVHFCFNALAATHIHCVRIPFWDSVLAFILYF